MAMLKKMAKGLTRKKPMTRQQKLKKAMGSTEGMTTAQKQKLITKKAKESAKTMDRKISMIKAQGASAKGASAKYQQQAQATNAKRKTYNIEIDGKDYSFGFSSKPTQKAIDRLRKRKGITAAKRPKKKKGY